MPSVLFKRAVAPTAVLFSPMVLEKRANVPLAMFWPPVVLLRSAPAPVAVFSFAVFTRSVPAPTPVQKLPSARLRSEYMPNAELYKPVVRLPRASCPSAVLPPGYPPSGAGTTPKDFGVVQNAHRPSAKSVVVRMWLRVFIS